MSRNFNQKGKLCADEKCIFQSWKPHTHRSHEQNNNGVYSDILNATGRTPMVKLNKIPIEAGLKCDVYAKVEFLNPGGSTKDRMSIRMIEDAEEQGLLKPGCTIIEPTSGNTGIGLAMACAVKGYKCIIVMTEKISDEKEATLKVLGAQVIRTPNGLHHDHPDSFMGVSKRLNKEIPDSVMLAQFSNSSNPLVHYDDTAEEIIQQCDGQLDMLVLGAGTGGSMTGISYKLKEECPNCEVIGVDPVGSCLALPDSLNETDVNCFDVEGIGYKYVWETLNRQYVKRWFKIDDKTSFGMARRLIREEGILAGGTSGSILAGALIAAKDLKEGQKCVIILPDGIRNYMTKFVNDNWMEAKGYKEIVNEHNHWWWNHTVGELDLPKVMSIKSNTTCKDALEFLRSNGLTCAPIESSIHGTFDGLLSLKYVTQKIVSQNYHLGDPVEKAMFQKFQRVNNDTSLGLVSRMLEIDEFVAVKDDADHPIGIISHMQLLSFIANGLKVISKVNNEPIN